MVMDTSAVHSARRMVASSKVIRVGPWGGHGGSPWDDGPHRGVRSITVTYGRFLESMRAEYAGDRNGRPVLGEKHGGGATGRSVPPGWSWTSPTSS